MSSGLIGVVKLAAKEVVDTSQPSDLRFGTVVSVSPLKIQITAQLVLPEALLVVPEHLTDHSVQVTVNATTSPKIEDDETETVLPHSHSLTGKQTITIHNSLRTGDKVALLRKTGGQTYYVLDRI